MFMPSLRPQSLLLVFAFTLLVPAGSAADPDINPGEINKTGLSRQCSAHPSAETKGPVDECQLRSPSVNNTEHELSKLEST
ncbi:hypothetical protein CRENBAI_026416 [Crenichthys baileyi]|uniref:Uncharacterized protein n=1 Tax=Crenichthys baileyi TaxID=28760 RepID=A0AAV9REI0_9TELE